MPRAKRQRPSLSRRSMLKARCLTSRRGPPLRGSKVLDSTPRRRDQSGPKHRSCSSKRCENLYASRSVLSALSTAWRPTRGAVPCVQNSASSVNRLQMRVRSPLAIAAAHSASVLSISAFAAAAAYSSIFLPPNGVLPVPVVGLLTELDSHDRAHRHDGLCRDVVMTWF